MHEEALTTELPRAAHADPTARITAVAGALMLGALAAALEDAGPAVTLSLLGAGVVLALFVLVPRAAAAIRRHPVAAGGRVVAVIPVTFIFGVGYFGDGLYVYGLPASAELAPVALIALAALGGVVLLADDLRAGGRLVTRGSGSPARPRRRRAPRGGRWRGSR